MVETEYLREFISKSEVGNRYEHESGEGIYQTVNEEDLRIRKEVYDRFIPSNLKGMNRNEIERLCGVKIRSSLDYLTETNQNQNYTTKFVINKEISEKEIDLAQLENFLVQNDFKKLE